MTVAIADHQANDITTWLSLLYDHCDDTGWLSLFSIDRTTGTRHTDWAPVTDYERLADAAITRAATSCVWLGVATRHKPLPEGKRGGREDCFELPGLWVDIDIAGPNHKTAEPLPPDRAAAHALVREFPLPPSAVVDSGGGLQAWWLFAEPLAADDQAQALLDRWGATWLQLADRSGWHLDNVFEVARVMRLPGTMNRKTTPTRVQVVDLQGHRYSVDDLDSWLIDPPTPAQAPAGERLPYIGPTRPGDAFNALHDASELLASTGWTLARTDSNGDQHWTRPGKDVREGTSATVYAEDGHCTIWSSTAVAMWPTLEVRRPYDAFGLYTHLHHQGDWRAASDELKRRGYGTKAAPDTDLHALIGATPTSSPTQATQDTQEPGDRLGSTWQRRPLQPIVEGLMAGTLERPKPTLGRIGASDLGLFYRGRVNGLYGEPNKGKTMVALAVAVEVLNDGGAVAWIDLEEPADGIVGRLLDMGATPKAIIDRFAFFAPEERISVGEPWLAAELDALAPTLAVIDSTGEALALEGAGPNHDDEVANWFRTWPRWIATRTGAGVVVIDHVVKDETTRGLWPGGSQRKKAAINGSAFMVAAIKELGRGVEGRLKITTSKDRHGNHRPGSKAAEFVLDARTTPARWRIEPVDTPGEGMPFRPTVLMERVSRWLEEHQAPASKRAIADGVKGNHDARAKAIDRLVEEGYVRRWIEGQVHLHEHVRPYREALEMVAAERTENA